MFNPAWDLCCESDRPAPNRTRLEVAAQHDDGAVATFAEDHLGALQRGRPRCPPSSCMSTATLTSALTRPGQPPSLLLMMSTLSHTVSWSSVNVLAVLVVVAGGQLEGEENLLPL